MRSGTSFVRLVLLAGLVLTGCAKSQRITAPDVSGTAVQTVATGGMAAEPARAAALGTHQFVPRSDNPYFPLVPGAVFEYRSKTKDGIETEVFRGDPEALHSGEANALFTATVGRNSVLVLDGAPHARQRRVLVPPLKGERMRAFFDAMRRETLEAVRAWPVGAPFPALPGSARWASGARALPGGDNPRHDGRTSRSRARRGRGSRAGRCRPGGGCRRRPRRTRHSARARPSYSHGRRLCSREHFEVSPLAA